MARTIDLKAPPTPGETQAALERLDKDINELKAKYELYFMGIERREPLPMRRRIAGTFRALLAQPPRNTALKFKLSQLRARMTTLESHWERIERMREQGVYRRDRNRVARRQEQAEKAPETSARPAPAGQLDVSDDRMARLHRTYVEARKRCGQSTSVSLDQMSSALRKQATDLVSRAGGRSLEFKVVIREGKAVIKAVPK